MRKKKFFLTLGAALVFIFLVSGVETIREELGDQKLEKKLSLDKPRLEKSFEPFLKEENERDDICSCTEKVATLIDHILYRGSKNFIRRPVSKTIAKTMSLTALPICLLCDTAQYTAKGSFEGALILFTEEKGDKNRFEKHFSKVKRCLLGFAAFPTGVISADMVSQHFVVNHSGKKLVEPYGKLYSTKCLELYPRTHKDVAMILNEAKQSGKKATFAGALMSQGKQALPIDEEDLLIHFDALNQVTIDPASRIARVGAGALWSDVQAAANEHGLAVKVMQASNVFSIGGSLSINCHGWDHKAGTLKETVHSLLIVNGEGEIQRLFPEDELFDLVIGGLGGFGAILEAELALTQNIKMSYESVEMPAQEYLSYFQNQVMNNEKLGMHYFRLCFDPKHMFETGIALNYFEESSEGVISAIPFEPARGNTTERVELGIIRRLPKALPIAWQMERSGSLGTKKTDRNEAMTFHLRCIFNESTIDAEWLQEYFVPAHQLNDFISFLGDVLKKNDVPVYNASIRYVKQNESLGFSYAPHEDMFAIVLFFNQSLLPEEIQKSRLWIQSVIDYLIVHEGTYYLPYQNFATLEQFHSCYPEWEKIAEKKRQYDPHHLFTNGFYEEYVLGKNTLIADSNRSNFRSTFSDPLQRKWVEEFLNHVFMQLDQKKFMALVDDILTDSSVNDEDVYRILQQRLSEGSFSFLKKNKQALKSLSTLKEDLSDQMLKLMGKKTLRGYVEIGYPGRLCRPLKKKLDLKGPIYVINEGEQLADYVESGFPRPYNRFVYLNEYEPILHQDIPTESVDLVAMYIGLHHIPENKLESFVRSIHRILRPGGSFVLMDHDALSSKHKEMLFVIHSIFNVGTNVPLDEELREFRNFQSLANWESLLEKCGFARDSHPPLIRQGDATLNSLIRFTKKATTEEEFCAQIHADPEYVRDPIRTYLTAPEWHNVRLTQGYCKFIEDIPFYQFPWFTEIKNMWSVFGKSWKVARRHASFSEVLFSDCTLMNLFITIFNTVEYAIKGAISYPLSLIYTNESIEDARNIHLLVRTNTNLTEIDPRIRIEKECPESHLKHIILPRYMEMFHILLKLSNEDLTYVDIAGQKKIQVDLNVEKNQELTLPLGCEKLYEIPATADPSRVYLALDVDVEHLNAALKWFQGHKIPIVYIHDF
ncbi:MAG: FAD-binding protein [Simkania sp.]|nr:FAD-binding protein [Simkania sp.]MCP5490842.1 FAD-binding protein [Chlamydiales bacterium]